MPTFHHLRKEPCLAYIVPIQVHGHQAAGFRKRQGRGTRGTWRLERFKSTVEVQIWELADQGTEGSGAPWWSETACCLLHTDFIRIKDSKILRKSPLRPSRWKYHNLILFYYLQWTKPLLTCVARRLQRPLQSMLRRRPQELW